jgi:CRISPR system Cascade subunit CasE
VTTLSRIWLNPLRSGGQRLLGSPQRMHAAVLGGFAELAPADRVLWRLEVTNPHRPALLVLGPGRPDWTHIVEQAGWPTSDADQVRVADYGRILDQVVLGRQFAFKLTANPVQNVRPSAPTPGGEPGRYQRVGHRTERHQRQWFLDRTAQWGFVVPSIPTPGTALGLDANADVDHAMRVTRRDRLSFTKGDSTRRVVIQTATFEGRLEVTNPDALRSALLRGIGPAKGYGCGLLTLAPARTTGDGDVVEG